GLEQAVVEGRRGAGVAGRHGHAEGRGQPREPGQDALRALGHERGGRGEGARPHQRDGGDEGEHEQAGPQHQPPVPKQEVENGGEGEVVGLGCGHVSDVGSRGRGTRAGRREASGKIQPPAPMCTSATPLLLDWPRLAERPEAGLPYLTATPDSMKRALDLALAGVGIVLAAPVLLLVGVMIRLAMGPPVLFVQERAGRGGRPFRLYKFRTMRPAPAPELEVATDAQRLTGLGRWLRRWSLDELPQLWNVCTG